MKKTLNVLVALFAIGFTQITQAQVVAVINRADWCHVCEKNGARIMNEIMPEYKGKQIEFVVNDLSNDKTKETSMKELEKAGVWTLIKKEKMTGNIILIDKRNSTEISRISVAKTTAEINMAITESIQTSLK